jgi:hypothetical protein
MLKLLVEAGADTEIPDNYGKTALQRASEMWHTEVVEYLVAESKWRRFKAWAMVLSSIRDEEQLTPMMKALLCDDLAREIASYL